jgi:DNA segregation ATPase FtsK/SpoIIIE, S-DNA-T family
VLGLRQNKRPPKGRARAKPKGRASTGRPKKPPAGRPPAWKAHGPDAMGLAVLFLAVLTALALAGSAGPVGQGIDWMLRGLYGDVAYVVPFATLLVSLAAFVRREEATRIFIGTLLLTTALAGIVHLWNGTEPLTGDYEGLATGGGALGAFLAVPLERYVGAWAGALACIFIGVLGGLITTKTSLRRGAEATWNGSAIVLRFLVRALVRSLRRAGSWIDRQGQAHVGAEEADDAVPEDDEGYEAEFVDPPTIDVDEQPTVENLAPVLQLRAEHATAPAQAELDLKMPKAGTYKIPPPAIFRRGQASRGQRGADDVARVLERTLQEFGVDGSVGAITRGPTVTRFEVQIAAGVKVARVLSLADDIAYALGSADIRLIAPIPGKSAIGVEVPNRDRDLVTVGDIVHSAEWKSAQHPLTCALGKDISGAPALINLAEMPHLLIAGSTGAGKSSCLNSLISSLLARAKPEEVRLILIDPKMVELSHFDNLPHLLSPVVTHPKRASETLSWVVREMERRYQELSLVGQRNLDLYNAAVRAGTLPAETMDGSPREELPYIAVFVDELADLMMVAARAVEDSICRIAQMARAVGIHLVVATQRPSVDVVTGLIKANIPSRIAFATASQADSRVILDMGGADKLVGHGDMLYLPTGTSKPRRVQGAYISEKELEQLTSFVRAQGAAQYEDEVLEAATRDEEDDDGDSDPLLDEAMELVIRTGMGSTSMLQRKLRVGFSRAGRLMDLLERKGVVGQQEGSKARSVLVTLEMLEEMRARTQN